MMNTPKIEDTKTPIKQIQAIFAATPASALHLLYQQTNEPLSVRAKALLESVATDYLAELTPLIKQIDYSDLASWLRVNESTFEQNLSCSLRQNLANEYMAVNVSRNNMPVIRYSRTVMEISPGIIANTIEQHIEGSLLAVFGSEKGQKECVRFMTAMINQGTNEISPFGVLVLDELFSTLISEFEKHGISDVLTKH